MASMDLTKLWTDNGKTYREAKKLQNSYDLGEGIARENLTEREKGIYDAGTEDGWNELSDQISSIL